MQWVTRARPKTDRLARPRLIRRFIHPNAEIVHMPAERVLKESARLGARSFDAQGADYTHRPAPDGREWCTLEALIAEVGSTDPALLPLARIVHAADVATDRDPFGPALLAIGMGGIDVEPDDQRLPERGMYAYDALYAWCLRETKQDAT